MPDFGLSRNPYVGRENKLTRNQRCPCGSGKKLKKCCPHLLAQRT
jgi:uncharacterized protein YchJ